MSSQSVAELNPGSFNDFTSERGINPNLPEAISQHGQALCTYRAALAAERGISLDELHLQIGSQVIEPLEAA